MSGADYLTIVVLVVIGVLAVCAMWARDARPAPPYESAGGATDGSESEATPHGPPSAQ